MKRVLLVAALAVAGCDDSGVGPSPRSLTGTWEGALSEAGQTLPVELRLTDVNGSLTGFWNRSPFQSIDERFEDLSLNGVGISGDYDHPSVRFEAEWYVALLAEERNVPFTLLCAFTGTVNDARNRINGTGSCPRSTWTLINDGAQVTLGGNFGMTLAR